MELVCTKVLNLPSDHSTIDPYEVIRSFSLLHHLKTIPLSNRITAFLRRTIAILILIY